jgi:hypothetical protein
MNIVQNDHDSAKIGLIAEIGRSLERSGDSP